MSSFKRGVAIVTGATQGIGLAAAKKLALMKYTVILVCRDDDRGSAAAKNIRQETKNEQVFNETADVGMWVDITALKKRYLEKKYEERYGRLRVLVNNAAECPKTQKFVKLPQVCNESKEGYSLFNTEKQFATNVLGYHFMIRAFSQELLTSAKEKRKPRVVNVASNWAGDLDLNDLHFKKRRYDNDSAYRQSKQANRLLTVSWAERLPGVLVNACHPGDPCTKLSRQLGYNLHATRDCSICKSPVYLATTDDDIGTGGWFESNCRKLKCRFASSSFTKVRAQLFNICESFCVEM